MSSGTPQSLSECTVCHARSAWAPGFVHVSGFIRSSRTVCVTCWQYDRTYRKFYARWAFWTLVVVLAGYFQTGSMVLGAGLALALYGVAYSAVVVHELGHALTAIALGFRVSAFSLGGGVRTKILALRNTFLLLGPSPVEGLVVLHPRTTRHYRKKMALILLAGSAVNLLCALLAINAEGLLEAAPARALAALWTAVNLVFVLNLLPVVSQGAFGPLRSDGLQLLDLLKLGDEAIAKQAGQAPLTEAYLAFQYGDLKHAHAAITPALSSGDLDANGRVIVTGILIAAGKTEEGIELSRRYLDAADYTDAERAMLMNNLACALVDSSDGVVAPARLAEADELTARAMAVLPMTNAIRATRAAVLIEKGAYGDAHRLLSDKRFRLDPPWIRAGVKATHALALAGLGQTDSAGAALLEATRLDPASAAVKQARERAARMLLAREAEIAPANP
jgi:hypothetical protein